MTYSLRLLGGISLDGPEGPLIGKVVQPRQSALLAVLSAAQDKGISRDKAVGLLWPESDRAEARHALSNSVYELRRALGENAVLVSGDNLRLNSEVIWTDVASFGEALEQGDLARAFEAYSGPFLDGFYLSGAEEFERWVESERQRLAVQYCEALESLAESAEEAADFPRAVGWWQRLVAYDPYNSRFAVRLMQSMAAAGDPANALQYAQEHERFLQNELGIDPPEDVSALAERLRRERVYSGATFEAEPFGVKTMPEGAKRAAEPTASASPASRTSKIVLIATAAAIAIATAALVFLPERGVSLDKNRILVAVFENRTGDPSLDPLGLMSADWITEGLSRVGIVEVVPSSAAMFAARGPGAKAGVMAGLDRATATASAMGAGTVVWGSYYLIRDSLHFQVQVTDASNGRLLSAPEPVSAPLDDPREAIDELRQRVMGGLAVSHNPLLGDSSARMLQPPQYDAYVEYAKGVEILVRVTGPEDMVKMNRHFHRAAVLDSTFVTALLLSTIGYWWLGQYETLDSIIRRVDASRDRLTPADREHLDFMIAFSSRDASGAYEAARRRLAIAEEPLWLWNLGMACKGVNRPRESAEAFERFDSELLVGTEFYDWYWYYRTMAYHMLGDHETELAGARQARRVEPQNAWLLALEIQALVALGRMEELRDRIDESLSLPLGLDWLPTEPMMYAAVELRAHGHQMEAKEVIERAIDWYRSRPPEEIAELTGSSVANIKYNLVRWLSWAGQYQEALLLIRGLARESPDRIAYLGYLGVLAARTGDGAEANRVSERLLHMDEPRYVADRLRWRASIAASLGDKNRALALVRESQSLGGWNYSLHRFWGLEPLWDDPTFQQLLEAKG